MIDPAQSSNKSGQFGFNAYEDHERRPYLPAASYSDGIYKLRPGAMINLRVLPAAALRMDHPDKAMEIIGVNP